MLNKLTANRFILTALQEGLAVYAVPLWLLVTFVMWWARTAFGWRHHLFMSKFKRHKIILRPVAVNYNAHCKNLQLFWHLSQKITILTSLAYLIRATEADGWVHGFKVSFSQQSVKVFMFFFAMDTRNCCFVEHMSKYLKILKFSLLLWLYRLQVEQSLLNHIFGNS